MKRYFPVISHTESVELLASTSSSPPHRGENCESPITEDPVTPIIEDESLNNVAKPEIKKLKKRIFYANWRKDPLLERWITENLNLDKEIYPVICSICNTKLKIKSGKSDLISHAKTKNHIQKSHSLSIQPTISRKLQESTQLKHKTIKAELQIAALTAEHNLAFNLADHLTPMIKNAYSDSQIAKNINCGRTKTGCLIRNVIGLHQFEKLCDLLRENKFSLCIDESTDVSTTKMLSLVIRVSVNFKVVDYFFDLIEVVNTDASTLYNEIIDLFIKSKINYKDNLIGFAADGANNMTGKNHSVAALLSKDCKNLIVLKCICHSFALCSSYACLKLPSSVETMAREIYSYVQNSPKRAAHLKEIIVLLEQTPRKILHPSQTRWLSLESVVNRLLTLYEPLKIFFGFAVQNDYIDSAEDILSKLKNPINELYLKFLKYILPKVNELNKLFQSESPQVHIMYDEIKRLVFTKFDNFLKPDYIKSRKIEDVNFKHPYNLVEEDKLYLGIEVQKCILTTNINSNDIKIFKNNCLSFYIELCDQIFKRFDFKHSILKYISLIDPQKIIKKQINSLYDLFIKFPNLVLEENLQNIDSEFREIRNLNFTAIFGELKDCVDLQVFWSTVCQIKREDKSIAFPLMGKFIFQILSLPNSSANVERTFSQINLNKTKIRNRLSVESLKGILLAKDYLKSCGSSCFDLKLNNELVKKFKSHELYSSNRKVED